MKHAYLLDMDGVIYREDHLIPGTAELIEAFNDQGIPFLFRTNKIVSFRPEPQSASVSRRNGRHRTDTENYRARYPRPPMTRSG